MFLPYLLLCLTFIFQAQALTYWIDSSCSGRLDENVMDEVRIMATEGRDRLLEPESRDAMTAAFELIFKVTFSTGFEYKKVKGK